MPSEIASATRPKVTAYILAYNQAEKIAAAVRAPAIPRATAAAQTRRRGSRRICSRAC